MKANPLPVGRVQAGRLVPDAVGNAAPAQIVDTAGSDRQALLVFDTTTGDTLSSQAPAVGSGIVSVRSDRHLYAFDPATGTPLWHTQIGQVTNAPETYMVDGRQHILVAAGDMLYSFALYQ